MTPKPKEVIILLGIPGSGKGTQAHRLAAEYGYRHISTGELLRALEHDPQADPHDLEQLAGMKQGHLVPDELIYKIAFAAIKAEFAAGRGVVLDGAVRNAEQAAHYETFLREQGKLDSTVVLELELDDETSFLRLTKRKICQACGHIISYSPDNDHIMVCSECGGELIVRTDDAPEIIRQRLLEQGNAAVAPVANYFAERGHLVRINARLPIAEVEYAIRVAIES